MNQDWGTHTDHESSKEGIDPAHDHSLRDHHSHVPLHHAHHAFHGCRIRHWIALRLAPIFWVFQERAILVRGDEVFSAGVEG